MSSADDKAKARKDALDAELNEGLEETFPASDPVSVTRAAKGERPIDEVDNDAVETDDDEIETAAEIGFASEAGNR